MKKLVLLLSVVFVFSSCDDNDILSGILNGTLTEEEIANGLIEALDVGLSNAVVEASGPTDSTSRVALDAKGFLKNEVIKILLPESVTKVRNAVSQQGAVPVSFKIPVPLVNDIEVNNLNVPVSAIYQAYLQTQGLSADTDIFENLIVAMNQGAEKAAVKALPIFGTAIKNITFDDAKNILQGGDNSATQFFADNTSQQLISAFAPDIDTALSATDANKIYSQVKGILEYSLDITPANITNLVGAGSLPAGSTQALSLLSSGEQLTSISFASALNLESIPNSLGEHATSKAVDGLFHLIGEEEKNIRENPLARVTDLLKKVFGSPEAQSATN